MTLFEHAGADPYVSDHGDLTYDVVRYDLALTYGIRGNHLDAHADVTVLALDDDLDKVRLDLHGLDVRKVTVDGRPAKYTYRSHHLTVRLPLPLAAGDTVTIGVRYAGNPQPFRKRHLGTAGWEELTDGVIVASQPHGAPSWFPCNDRPSSKAGYRISVTTASEYVVVSNGALVDETRHGRTTTWVYEQQEPMAPYLATVQIGRYDLLELPAPACGVPVTAAVPRRLAEPFAAAFARQGDMVDFFSRIFGTYPFEGYRVVVTDDDLEIPLESQTLATFGANLVRTDWDAERLIAHELAHQWFGNSLTAATWKDIWLHEGFACYSEWLWSEHSGKETAQERAAEHWQRLAGLDQDLVLADPGADLMFDDRVYKRGALFLHAIRLTIGDEPFFELLATWVRDFSGGSVTTSEFLDHLSSAAGHELAELSRAWLHEPELPKLPDGS